MKSLFFSFLFLFAFTASAATYQLDKAHSRVGFEIAHLVIATVEGHFKEFEGSFDYDSKKRTIQNVNVSIQMASVDTNETDRDNHLRKEDFFHVEKYPTMTFKNVKVTFGGGKPREAKGDLTLRGVTKPMKLKIKWKGEVTDPWGNEKVAFDLEGKIKRKDFGLTWNKKLDKGGVMIGEDVTLRIRVEANKK